MKYKKVGCYVGSNLNYSLRFINVIIENKIEIESTMEGICGNKSLIDVIQSDIEFNNNSFGQWEKIKKFKLTPEIWSVDLGHLTPTMKVKRKIVQEKYQNLIDDIYGD